MTHNLDKLRGMGYLMEIHNRAEFPFISVSLCQKYPSWVALYCVLLQNEEIGVLANENFSGSVIFHSSVAIYFKPNVLDNRSL